MRTIILCLLSLFMVTLVKAQSNTASLNITLTDVQSVTFTSAALNEAASMTQQMPKNGSLQVLSRSTSQIKKISSQNSEYKRLYNEFYSADAANNFSSSDKNSQRMAVNRTNSARSSRPQNNSNLVIYQIDPR